MAGGCERTSGGETMHRPILLLGIHLVASTATLILDLPMRGTRRCLGEEMTEDSLGKLTFRALKPEGTSADTGNSGIRATVTDPAMHITYAKVELPAL